VRLVRVPAADHAPGTMRPIYDWANGYPRVVSDARGPEYMPKGNQTLTKPIGFIAQVPHTYGLWENDYGVMNEHNLAMGESTLNSKLVGFSARALAELHRQVPVGHRRADPHRARAHQDRPRGHQAHGRSGGKGRVLQ
jgi:dipeptidase